MRIRQSFFRVDNASTLILTSDVDLISINTTDAVILKLPIDLPEGKQIKIKSLVVTPNVTVQSWNGSTLLTPTNEITIIEYTNQYIFTEIEEGGGGYTGWSANTQRTELDSNLGFSVSTKNGTYDYISIIDTSAGDVTIDISALENTVYYIKKFKKVGANKLFLQSFAGFSDFSSLLEVPESCCIVYDPTNQIWEILYNNTVTNTIIKSKKITGIDCQTWSAGIEIEPTKAGVIFMPMTAFLVAEDNHTNVINANINSSTAPIGAAFTATTATNLNTGDNVSFALFFNGTNEFKNDLYLFGADFVNPGTVTLYVTYQEI